MTLVMLKVRNLCPKPTPQSPGLLTGQDILAEGIQKSK